MPGRASADQHFRAVSSVIGETAGMPSWWLDELAHAGAEHLDASYVAGYDRKSGVDPAADVALLREHGLGPGTTLIDLGCGTGLFSIAAAACGALVIAVDVSAAMTASLRSRVEALGIDNIEVRDAGFLSYEHEGPLVDFAFTRNALHHLPDFWTAIALRRTGALLRQGGILQLHDLIYDFGPGEAADHIQAWLDGAVSDPEIGYTAADLATHVRTEFSTYRWLLEPMIERAGFTIEDRHFRRGVYGRYTCRKIA